MDRAYEVGETHFLPYSFCIKMHEIYHKRCKRGKMKRKKVRCSYIFSDARGNAKVIIHFFSTYVKESSQDAFIFDENYNNP